MGNPRVGLVIDTEAALRPDGERPNKQVRVIGDATVTPEHGGVWTRRIRAEYVCPAIDPGTAMARARMLITVTPRQVIAIASV
ncbi:hypothetical protein IRT45_12885 [Nocardia sp. BSTN01]|uniref:hypothetical protein n=1 Tax=Nocardia sp. BSTN01 TaxID=2783665 RepID=UPI00188E7E4F|nr:hypothetical protein [Nocardia sp. BSTN01]MBF4998046.1 hypothetical protein [Nocardia sp. BSTN01]